MNKAFNAISVNFDRMEKLNKEGFYTRLVEILISKDIKFREAYLERELKKNRFEEPFYIVQAEIPFDVAFVHDGYEFKRGTIIDQFHEPRIIVKISNRKGIYSPRFLCIREDALNKNFINKLKEKYK